MYQDREIRVHWTHIHEQKNKIKVDCAENKVLIVHTDIGHTDRPPHTHTHRAHTHSRMK